MKKLFLLGFVAAGFLLASCGEKASETSEPGDVADAAGTEYVVNAGESSVKWTGTKVGVYDHHGTVDIRDGKFTVADDKVTGGNLTIDMTTIDVELDETFDGEESKAYFLGHVSSADFFGVEEYPTSTFSVTKVEEGEEGKMNVSGNLKIRDVEKQVSFPVAVKFDGDKMMANGSLTVDRTEFGVNWGSNNWPDKIVNGIIVDNNMTMDFELSATKK